MNAYNVFCKSIVGLVFETNLLYQNLTLLLCYKYCYCITSHAQPEGYDTMVKMRWYDGENATARWYKPMARW